jgi:hypothetical protein
MKKISIKTTIVVGVVLSGLIVSYLVSNNNHDVTCVSNNNNNNHDVTCVTKNDNFDITKDGVYLKEFYKDSDDPFTKVNKDTIRILDIQESKRNGKFYVKWTFTKWNDTTRYISSELSYIAENTIRIK